MSRDFNSNNTTSPNKRRMAYRTKWYVEVYEEENGLGPKMIKDINFVERLHYGMIDNENNSIIPNEDFIVSTANGRVFDFVADAYSLMRLNFTTAVQRGLVSTEGSAFGNLDMVQSYKNPRLRYGEYLGNILRFYNNTHIPNVLGKTIIHSYEEYVKYFFDFLLKNSTQVPITMTKWNTSPESSILDTGLAFRYSNIRYDEDQRKVDEIIDHPSYEFIKNSCLNFGFSILHYTPQILLFDVSSPATESIRNRYGLINLDFLFSRRFIKTYTIDLELLFNNINIYFNKYVLKNPLIKKIDVKCGKTISEYIRLSPVEINSRPFALDKQIEMYTRIRNLEEGNCYSSQKVEEIIKLSKKYLKILDKERTLSYINDEFKNQVWNKPYGFHDLKQKLEGKTMTNSQRTQFGAGGTGGNSSY